jgi:iron complex outermembrane recepter protein
MKAISLAALAIVLVSNPAIAQNVETPSEEEDAGSAEIVVTATKRETKLQDTPIAIGIVTGEEVRDKHITGLADVAKSALSFQVGDNSVVPSAVVLTIRGLQSNTLIPSGDPSAAPHVDGIYTSR